MDVVKVFNDVQFSIEDLHEIRQYLDIVFSIIYGQGVGKASKLNAETSFSRTPASS